MRFKSKAEKNGKCVPTYVISRLMLGLLNKNGEIYDCVIDLISTHNQSSSLTSRLFWSYLFYFAMIQTKVNFWVTLIIGM